MNNNGIVISQLPQVPSNTDLSSGVVAFSYDNTTYSLNLNSLADQVKNILNISSSLSADDIVGLTTFVQSVINNTISTLTLDVARITGLDGYVSGKLQGLTLDASAITGLTTFVTNLINNALSTFNIDSSKVTGLQDLINSTILSNLDSLSITTSQISDFNSAINTLLSSTSFSTTQINGLTTFVQDLIDNSNSITVTDTQW